MNPFDLPPGSSFSSCSFITWWIRRCNLAWTIVFQLIFFLSLFSSFSSWYHIWFITDSSRDSQFRCWAEAFSLSLSASYPQGYPEHNSMAFLSPLRELLHRTVACTCRIVLHFTIPFLVLTKLRLLTESLPTKIPFIQGSPFSFTFGTGFANTMLPHGDRVPLYSLSNNTSKGVDPFLTTNLFNKNAACLAAHGYSVDAIFTFRF